jgi:HKD family nuclease
MKIEAIPNKGPASMGPEIDRSLEWAEQVDIASAFVTSKALNHLEKSLAKAQSEKRQLTVRLLFGLYQRFTPPEALKMMLDLQKKYPGRLYVQVARNNRFHWKLYIFRKRSSRRFYIGSANLTEDGLTSEGELSVKLTTKTSDAIANTLETEFDKLWKDKSKSFLLRKDVWKEYKKFKRPAFISQHEDSAISGLLTKPDRPPPPPTKPKPRIVFVDKVLLPETDNIIDARTNWDKKNWDYMCTGKQLHNNIVNAKVFLYVTWDDNPKKYYVEFRRVEETVELDTPDGKYFIAHSKIPYGYSLRYSEVKKRFEEVGLTWKIIKASRQLNSDQLQATSRLLHVKPETLVQE